MRGPPAKVRRSENCTVALVVRTVASIPALGLLAGAAAGLLNPGLPSTLGVALLFGCLIGAAFAYRSSRQLVLMLSVVAGFLVGGVLLAEDAWTKAWRPTLWTAFEKLAARERLGAQREGRRVPEDPEAFAILTGLLKSDASVGQTGVTLILDADSIAPRSSMSAESTVTQPHWPLAVSGGVQLTVVGKLAAEQVKEWRGGRRVRVSAQLHPPARYLDPGVPDFQRQLARRGTILVGTVKSGALVEVLATGGLLDERMGQVRAFARSAIDRGVGSWSSRSASIVTAIVIGDRAGLEDEVQRRLQDAGTYHVIAISGGNIAILAGLIVLAFRLAGALGRVAMVSAAVMLLGYARMVGGGASVERATFMAVLYFAARACDQRSPPLNTVAVVAIWLVSWEPLSVADPAFVLTFGATLAIVIAIPLLPETLPRFVTAPAALFVASLATEIALMPVGAIFFSRVTFAGLVLNFAAVPLMVVAQTMGMVVVVVALVSSQAALVAGFLAHLAGAGLVRSAAVGGLASALSLRVAPPGWVAVAAYYVAVISLFVARRHSRLRQALVVTAVASAIWIVAEPWAWVDSLGDGRLHVTFIDVGQGDAALVRFPSGTTMLVDAGGLPGGSPFDIGDRVVAPLLRTAGVRRLDILAVTHGDPDHIGGAESVIREFRPRQIWEGISVPPFEPLRKLRDAASSVGATWANLKRGDRTWLDEVEMVVLHPALPEWERQRVRNEDSLVLELRWKEVAVLLTGDIGREAERTLPNLPRPRMRVVKIAHHGSLSSSTTDFIRAAAPRVAVVSAGRSNRFGHPVPEVLQRYRDAGAEVFRTDQDGAVMVETDGHQLSVRGFTGTRLSIQ